MPGTQLLNNKEWPLLLCDVTLFRLPSLCRLFKCPVPRVHLQFTYNSTISSRTMGGLYVLHFYNHALINVAF